VSNFSIRPGTPDDAEAVLALMPRLAAFDVPETRDPVHLWRDDAVLFRRWVDGEVECLVHVADDFDGNIVGFSMVRLRPELLSHEPSAHLEAIALDERAEGKGVAKALLAAAEKEAFAHGALTMSLHVFANNDRARKFYDKAGYDGELMRYIKHLDQES
jgi:ribosomal protein S18 acetylase RimI-like enzyme